MACPVTMGVKDLPPSLEPKRLNVLGSRFVESSPEVRDRPVTVVAPAAGVTTKPDPPYAPP